MPLSSTKTALRILAVMFGLFTLSSHAESPEPPRPVPGAVLSLLDQSKDMKHSVMAAARMGATSYYIILQEGEHEASQALISLEEGKKPSMIAHDSYLFPLSQYRLPEKLALELAGQYIALEIRSNPGGIASIQKYFDENPPGYMAPEIRKAYQDAGIRFKKAQK